MVRKDMRSRSQPKSRVRYRNGGSGGRGAATELAAVGDKRPVVVRSRPRSGPLGPRSFDLSFPASILFAKLGRAKRVRHAAHCPCCLSSRNFSVRFRISKMVIFIADSVPRADFYSPVALPKCSLLHAWGSSRLSALPLDSDAAGVLDALQDVGPSSCRVCMACLRVFLGADYKLAMRRLEIPFSKLARSA